MRFYRYKEVDGDRVARLQCPPGFDKPPPAVSYREIATDKLVTFVLEEE